MNVTILSALVWAIMMTESGGREGIQAGDGGKAVGLYQLHQIAVDDVNKAYGNHYTPEDRKDPEKAKEIVERYLILNGSRFKRKYGKGPTIEEMARMYNGGPRGHLKESTLEYWKKVKAHLESR